MKTKIGDLVHVTVYDGVSNKMGIVIDTQSYGSSSGDNWVRWVGSDGAMRWSYYSVVDVISP